MNEATTGVEVNEAFGVEEQTPPEAAVVEEVGAKVPSAEALAEQIKELERRNRVLTDKLDKAVLGKSTGSRSSGKKRVRILVEEGRLQSDQDYVFVGVQGRGYRIRRGFEVDVPPEVVEVLEHARQGVVKPRPAKTGGVDFIRSQRFPFRNLGTAVDSDGNRLMPKLEYEPETLKV